MPVLTGCHDVEYWIPIQVQSVDSADSFIAYQFHLIYDTTLIQYTGIEYLDTHTEIWGQPYINSSPGEIRIAGFSAEPLAIHSAEFDTLLRLGFYILKDTIHNSEIHFEQCLLFNEHGELSIDTLLHGEVFIVENGFPQIMGIPDQIGFEDEILPIELQDYVYDDDHELHQLNFEIQGDDFLIISLDPYLGIIEMSLRQDWSGQTDVSIKVLDPLGASDCDTFHVTVYPLEDPPKPFGLKFPENNAAFGEHVIDVEFSWEESINVDFRDTIVYHFYLSRDSTLEGELVTKTLSIPTEKILLSFEKLEGKYYWGVDAEDIHSNVTRCSSVFSLDIQTAVNTYPENIPMAFNLLQNYPNPFNGYTIIPYQLPKSGNVLIQVYDIQGRWIDTLLEGRMEAGSHQISWIPGASHLPASGLFFVRLQFEDTILYRKMILMK